ncbi:MAG: acetyl-CoA synthetase, partial [Thermoleophilales bacterium]|nr:acetyl-CoA synthetase [Thermoleophilales bacterium]
MNFARDVVDSSPAGAPALLALGRDGSRTEIEFGQVSDRSARLAGTLIARGVERGAVVMTLVGNRPEWVYAMVACFRIGAVGLPCTEQLRPADLRARIESVDPRVVVADERNLEAIAATGFDGPVLAIPDESLFESDPAPAVDLAANDPALITFTSGTAGEPKPIR